MDIGLYREYLTKYVKEAIANSDGSNPGIAEYLSNIRVSGVFVRHKDEKKRALAEARKAFEEHRHWPQEIVISYLGIDREELDT